MKYVLYGTIQYNFDYLGRLSVKHSLCVFLTRWFLQILFIRWSATAILVPFQVPLLHSHPSPPSGQGYYLMFNTSESDDLVCLDSPNQYFFQGVPLIARFMGPTWGPPGADRTQVGSMLGPWSLLSLHLQTKFWIQLGFVNYSISSTGVISANSGFNLYSTG